MGLLSDSCFLKNSVANPHIIRGWVRDKALNKGIKRETGGEERKKKGPYPAKVGFMSPIAIS